MIKKRKSRYFIIKNKKIWILYRFFNCINNIYIKKISKLVDYINLNKNKYNLFKVFINSNNKNKNNIININNSFNVDFLKIIMDFIINIIIIQQKILFFNNKSDFH